MNKRLRQVLLHVVSCALFMMLPFFFARGQDEAEDLLKNPFFQMDLLNYSILLIFFYVNYYYLIPSLFFKKKYILFILGVLIGFSMLLFVHLLIPHDLPKLPPGMPEKVKERILNENFVIREIRHHLFQFLVVLVFSFMIRIYTRWKQSEREKAAAELSYLKAQINPHFLFNTLNSIYSLALQKSDSTAPAVVKLSGMMRYVISEAHHELVPVDKEISYIHDYIDLQKMRLGDTVKINFSASFNSSGKKIAPLLLIPFIENAFKHGVNAEENSHIQVRINTEGDELTLAVHNNKVSVKNNEDIKSGLGIDNTKHRLQLLYPGKHKLTISDTDKEFSVNLTITLT